RFWSPGVRRLSPSQSPEPALSYPSASPARHFVDARSLHTVDEDDDEAPDLLPPEVNSDLDKEEENSSTIRDGNLSDELEHNHDSQVLNQLRLPMTELTSIMELMFMANQKLSISDLPDLAPIPLPLLTDLGQASDENARLSLEKTTISDSRDIDAANQLPTTLMEVDQCSNTHPAQEEGPTLNIAPNLTDRHAGKALNLSDSQISADKRPNPSLHDTQLNDNPTDNCRRGATKKVWVPKVPSSTASQNTNTVHMNTMESASCEKHMGPDSTYNEHQPCTIISPNAPPSNEEHAIQQSQYIEQGCSSPHEIPVTEEQC
ncbi:hypothetical protein Dimus_020166, partial [Dionaea muscipula]